MRRVLINHVISNVILGWNREELPRNTTVGKVLPRKTSRMPAMMRSSPPKK